MEYNTIPRPAPTPACLTYPEHVQAGLCPCNLYWIETCSRADHRQQAASVHLWELDDLVRTVTTVHSWSWSWRCVMTTSYVTVAVTASVVSWWPRLPVHRQSRHQVQLPSLPVASQCPAGKVSYSPSVLPTLLGPWQPDIDVFVRRYARSDLGPHILHLFVKKCFIAANTVFLIRYIGVIKSTSYW